jgi:hypothetical protein
MTYDCANDVQIAICPARPLEHFVRRSFGQGLRTSYCPCGAVTLALQDVGAGRDLPSCL